MSSLPVKTRGVARSFACCVSAATRTERETGEEPEPEGDPLSPVKPEETLGAVDVLGVGRDGKVQSGVETGAGFASGENEAVDTTRGVEEETLLSDSFEQKGNLDEASATPTTRDRRTDSRVPNFREHADAVAVSNGKELANKGTSISDFDASDLEARDMDVGGILFGDENGASANKRTANVMTRDTAETVTHDTATLTEKANATRDEDATERSALLRGDQITSSSSFDNDTSPTRKKQTRASRGNRSRAGLLLPVPFYRKPFASAKGVVLTMTSVAAAIAVTACALVFKYGTPFPVVRVDANGDALAFSETAGDVVVSKTVSETVSGKRGEKGGESGGRVSSSSNDDKAERTAHVAASDDGDLDSDSKPSSGLAPTRLMSENTHLKTSKESLMRESTHSKTTSKTPSKPSPKKPSNTPSTRSTKVSPSVSAQRKSVSKRLAKSSKSSSRASKSSPKRGSKKGEARLGEVGEDAGSNPEVSSVCVSTHNEAKHGMHRQHSTACGGTQAGLGYVGHPSAKCQRCYLSNTPAETQSGSLAWCGEEVCEQGGLTGCQRKRKRSASSLGAAIDSGSSSRKVARASLNAHSSRRAGPKQAQTLTHTHTHTKRTVGRCVTDRGDAEVGRFVWEDATCANGAGTCCISQIPTLFYLSAGDCLSIHRPTRD